MSKCSRYLLFLISTGLLFMIGCGGGTAVAPVSPSAPPNYYQIVTVSDLHFNPLYDPSLFPQLAAAPPSQWASIYKTSKLTAASVGGTELSTAQLHPGQLAAERKNNSSSSLYRRRARAQHSGHLLRLALQPEQATLNLHL